MEKVAKEGKRRRNSKEGFTKMNENGKMKDNIGGKVIQANPKIVEKSMKEKQKQEGRVWHG